MWVSFRSTHRYKLPSLFSIQRYAERLHGGNAYYIPDRISACWAIHASYSDSYAAKVYRKHYGGYEWCTVRRRYTTDSIILFKVRFFCCGLPYLEYITTPYIYFWVCVYELGVYEPIL